jgi:hypothetical protein
MVVVNVIINGKKIGKDIAQYDVTVNILRREDANDIEVQYAKVLESILTNVTKRMAYKIIKHEEIKKPT